MYIVHYCRGKVIMELTSEVIERVGSAVYNPGIQTAVKMDI